MIYINNESELNLNGLSVVKFYLEDCRPCKRLDTILTKMEKEFPEISFYAVNIDTCLNLAKAYEIKSAPTMVVFNGRLAVNKIVGLQSTEIVRNEFKKTLDTYKNVKN